MTRRHPSHFSAQDSPYRKRSAAHMFHLNSAPLSILSGLGHGAYGTLYLAQTHKSIQSPSLVAVKYLPQSHLNPYQKQLQRMEAKLHIHCQDHPNVLSVYAVHDLPHHDAWYMVLQYAPFGDLFDFISSGNLAKWINKTGTTLDAVIVDVFTQVCEAVQYCHAKGVYHRDLKPENIMITAMDESTGRLQVCLGDFGLATSDSISQDYGCGSVFYMAPECQAADDGSQRKRTGYNVGACDVWSLGVLLVNLTCRQNPWHRADNVLSDMAYRHYYLATVTGSTLRARRARALMDLLPVSLAFALVLTRVFEPDVDRRCTVAELLDMVHECTEGFTKKKKMTVMVERKTVKRASLYSLDDETPLEAQLAMHDEDVVDVHGTASLSPSASLSSVISTCSEAAAIASWAGLPQTPGAQTVAQLSLPAPAKSTTIEADDEVYAMLGM